MIANQPTLQELQSKLDSRFGGCLKFGSHNIHKNSVCALELRAAVLGLDWTDNPEKTRDWDLLTLNDISVPNELRTKALLPVLAAYGGALDWPAEKQRSVLSRLIVKACQGLLGVYARDEKLRAAASKVCSPDDILSSHMSASGLGHWVWRSTAQAFAQGAWATAAGLLAKSIQSTLAYGYVAIPHVSEAYEAVCQIWVDAVNEPNLVKGES